MEENPQKDSAAVRIFPPAIPLVTVLAGIGLDYVWPITPEFVSGTPVRIWLGGLIVAVALFGLGLWSVVLMRRKGQSPNPWKPTPEIVEQGPYRLTRNPMYLQMVLICIGIAIMMWNLWILILTPVGAWLLQRLAIKPEEEYLERKFGDAYCAYKGRVRRWI